MRMDRGIQSVIFPEPPKMKKGAIISACGRYRYKLWRIWDEGKPKVLFIMHNPSKADENDDDPTIRRCIGFAKSWGYGGIYVGNLTAYRCTNPKDLINDPNTDFSLNAQRSANKEMSKICDLIVYAYGVPFSQNLLWYIDHSDGHYLQLTKDGHPGHPLFLPKSCKPIPYPF